MDNKVEIFSKFKNNLDNYINEYKNKLEEIASEEEFIQSLGDLINYCKSDVLLLPFYDEEILTSILNRIFPLSNNEINKIKTAKYLIEASKTIDKSHFVQYNKSIKEIETIFNNINTYYENKLNDETIKTNKEDYESIVNNYTKIYEKIEGQNFNNIIDDVDLFEQVLKDSSLEMNEINIILNTAITDNLKYLDNNGIINVEIDNDIKDLKEENNKIQKDISDLNDLLGE